MRVPWSGCGDRRGATAVLRHAEQGAFETRREDDHAVAIPRASTRRRGVAEDLGWASRQCDLLELALGEEPQVSAIRRPERERRVVGAGDRPRVERIDRSNPEARRTTLI